MAKIALMLLMIAFEKSIKINEISPKKHRCQPKVDSLYQAIPSSINIEFLASISCSTGEEEKT